MKGAETFMNEKIVIYGAGKYLDQNIEKLLMSYKLVGIVDKKFKGLKHSIKVEEINAIYGKEYDLIMIMVKNIGMALEISDDLIQNYAVDSNKILFGFNEFENKEWDIHVLGYSEFEFLTQGLRIKARTIDEINNLIEIANNSSYDWTINNDKKNIIIDVGVNIGGSVLYFLKCKQVKKIYGFEPFTPTYEYALENIKKNNYDRQEYVEIYNIGLSNEDRNSDIKYNSHMTCGQSTLSDLNECARKNYEQWGLLDDEDSVIEKIEVKAASNVLRPIFEENKECNIILKLDCEGEETNILNSLDESNLLKQIDFIMMEWHFGQKLFIEKLLIKAGFSFWNCDKGSDMGLLYAFKLR